VITTNLVEEHLTLYRVFKDVVCEGKEREAQVMREQLRAMKSTMTEKEQDEMFATLAGIRSNA
jgi:hypothetical protein